MNAQELQKRIGELSESERAEVAKTFLSVFLSNGFGALTKRDAESLIFGLLRKAIGGGDDVDPYTWAKVLKITPSRVNSLQLESHLRFGHLFSAQKPDERLGYLRAATVDFEIGVDSEGKELTSGIVRLQMDDPVGRMEIEQAIKELHGVVDYELNRKNLKLKFVDFLRLINQLAGDDEEDVINKIAEVKARENSELAKMLEEIKNAKYAALSEPGKLKKFVELCVETFAEKPKKLIDHIGLIFGSQKHQKKK